MMGRTHCMSGAAAGLALAPVVGLGQLTEAIPFAATMAGYALVPDLDCREATASRLLGPITGVLSTVLAWSSKKLYQATRGPRDEGGPDHGNHRHLTHCALWCVLIGLVAGWTSTLSPWVTLGWVCFGVAAATEALGDLVLLAGAAAVGLPLLLHGTGPLDALAGMSGPALGIAAGLGCAVHIAGDMSTVTGVPLLWPVSIQGRRWRDLHLLPHGMRLHTGHWQETVVFFAFAGALVLVGTTFIPGAWGHLAGLVTTGGAA